MKISDFDYRLPAECIAQYPLAQRTASKLMVVNVKTQTISHHQFTDISSFLQPDDLVVLNDTKVIPARLYGEKESGGKVECLIERILENQLVLAHIRASKSPKIGCLIHVANRAFSLRVKCRQGDLFQLVLLSDRNMLELLEQFGEIPLPPYIERTPDAMDVQRYQTIFANKPGAIAAPTASLHFDANMLSQLKQKGITQSFVTLHVGAGTFQPVRVENLSEHRMHSELIDVSAGLCEQIKKCKAKSGRLVAVGTTVLRSLESTVKEGVSHPFQGETDLFILPGYSFQVVDILLTNFHLPKSTLLMLVCAFAEIDLIREAYRQAVKNNYRFFSYGDAMLILK